MLSKKNRRKPQITKIKNEKGNFTTILTEINWLAHLHSHGGEYEKIGGRLLREFQKWLSRKICKFQNCLFGKKGKSSLISILYGLANALENS